MSALIDHSRRLGAPVLLTAGLVMTGCGGAEGGGSKASTAPAKAPRGTTAASVGRAPDACGLLTQSEVATGLGEQATRKRDAGMSLDGHSYSQCRWTAGRHRIGVVVVASTARYETQRKLPGGDPVRGLGDAAIAREGTSLETVGGTGGRTIAVKAGKRSLVVALDLGGTVGARTSPSGTKVRRSNPVTTADVVALAGPALRRLGSR